MKPYHLYTAFLLLPLTGCKKEGHMEFFREDRLFELEAPKENVALNTASPEREAIKLVWTAASNCDTDTAIIYTFQMDVQGNNSAGGINESLGRETYERVYKNEELSNLSPNTFKVAADTEATMEVCIIAQVASDEGVKQQISMKTVVFETHTPISNTLCIISSAAPHGWNADQVKEVKPVEGAPKTFAWSGRLFAGGTRLTATKGQSIPSYGRGSNDGGLHFREIGADSSNEKLIIAGGDACTVKVNLVNLTISITKGEVPEYTELQFVDEPAGWSFRRMAVGPADPFMFHYNVGLGNGGEFKIRTKEGGWGAVFFYPEESDTPKGGNLPVKRWAGDLDYEWKIATGTYKIMFDTHTVKIDIVPFTPYTAMYMIGSTTDTGWDINSPTTMTVNSSNPGVFTWEDDLKTDELKLSCGKESDQGGDWFLISKVDRAPASAEESMILNVRGSNPGSEWRATEAGIYRITLNQPTRAVVVKKQ